MKRIQMFGIRAVGRLAPFECVIGRAGDAAVPVAVGQDQTMAAAECSKKKLIPILRSGAGRTHSRSRRTGPDIPAWGNGPRPAAFRPERNSRPAARQDFDHRFLLEYLVVRGERCQKSQGRSVSRYKKCRPSGIGPVISVTIPVISRSPAPKPPLGPVPLPVEFDLQRQFLALHLRQVGLPPVPESPAFIRRLQIHRIGEQVVDAFRSPVRGQRSMLLGREFPASRRRGV